MEEIGSIKKMHKMHKIRIKKAYFCEKCTMHDSNKSNEAILDLAKSYGFDAIEKPFCWNGYEVYTPYNKDGSMPFIGQPVFILKTRREIRVAAEFEWQEILDMLE